MGVWLGSGATHRIRDWAVVFMRKFIFGVVFLVVSGLASLAVAQQTMWVQIEAQRSLGRAQEVARAYSGSLPNITGFATRTGWYAIAMGPFSAAQAADILQQLRITRQIPSDSYVVDGSQFGRRFWPIGAATGTTPQVAPENQPNPAPTSAQSPETGGETLAEARRSEKLLDRQGRMQLQIALQWEGFYTSAIDGAFGRGTRRSMAAWQAGEGFDTTGVLTAGQRDILTARYQRMLATLGMALLVDDATGIQIQLPGAMVTFERYDPPFAHFKAKDGSAVQVLLISQDGDQATLRALFDVMQTLEIVPLDGARKMGRKDFTLTGENDELSSYTYAALADGHVKGFTLIWPGPPDRRRDLVLNAMKNSFVVRGDAVLPDVYGDADAAQAVDLLAGLNIRRPDSAASGFYVNGAGAILTAAQAVSACGRITIDDDLAATVVALDPQQGLALLRPARKIIPIAVAQFGARPARLNAEVAAAGYSYGGLLAAPALTFGTLADVRGLNGETSLHRLAISATPGDSGGPVFADDGSVLGMLLPAPRASAQKLPPGVGFAVNSATLSDFLAQNGISPQTVQSGDALAPEDLSMIAADITVLVNCWN